MTSLADRLLRAAAQSRRFLQKKSRSETARFILSRRAPDGGFRGRDEQSDLYYTVFAVLGLKTLGAPIPALSLWRYCRRFGNGEELDLVHLACLIQLRSAFPMLGKTRRKFSQTLKTFEAASAYDRFLKQLAADRLRVARFLAPPPPVERSDPTPSLAAAMVLNPKQARAAVPSLLDRACPRGGFAANAQLMVPDLLSTATALFALTQAGANLDSIRRPCLEYVESLWRDSGGFAGHGSDEFEDVEYTFYGLLSIGCLVGQEVFNDRKDAKTRRREE